MTERACDNCKHNITMKKCHKCHTYEKNGVVHYHTKFKAKKPEPSSWDELCRDMERAMLKVNTVLKDLDITSRENRDRRLKEEEDAIYRKEKPQMKAKLIINNQEIEIEISQEEYEKLKPKETKTGYECVKADDRYYFVSSANIVEDTYDDGVKHDKERHKSANYYSARSVAENNARADKLMRQLRRFAVERREKEFDWNNDCQAKYFIACDYRDYELRAVFDEYIRYYGVIYFDTREKAQAAIDTFHDELIWYFTEYKDSL